MHLFSRVKALTGLLTFLMVSGMVLGTAALSSTPASAAPAGNSVTTFHGTAITLQARSGPFSMSGNSAHAAVVQQGPHLSPLHLVHPISHAHVAQTRANGLMPQGESLDMDNNVGTVLHNIKGLTSVDSFNANGFVLEPPDQGLCVGNLNLGKGVQKVVWPFVNDVAEITATDGTRLAGPLNLNQFFGEPANEGMSDPRCTFDNGSQAFYFVVLAIDPSGNTHTDLVSITSAFAENEIQLDTTEATNAAGGCPCFGDQPKLGIDSTNVYTTDDQFSNASGAETGDTLFIVSKSDLLNHATMVHSAEFVNLALNGIPVLALQPAVTIGRSSHEFLLNSFPFDAQGNNIATSHMLGLWSVGDPDDVSQGQTPTLSATTINSPTYAFPVAAQTTNGHALAAMSSDDRMQNVEFVNGVLFGALASAVNVRGDSVTRDGASWFAVLPIAFGAHLFGVVVDHSVVTAPKAFILDPAIVVTNDWTIGIAFSVTSPTLNPSTAFAVRKAGHRSFDKVHITALGAGPDIGFTCQAPFVGTGQECRWGDYSWATLDPNGDNMWMASEYIVPDVASQTANGQTFQTNWGTRMWDVAGNE